MTDPIHTKNVRWGGMPQITRKHVEALERFEAGEEVDAMAARQATAWILSRIEELTNGIRLLEAEVVELRARAQPPAAPGKEG